MLCVALVVRGIYRYRVPSCPPESQLTLPGQHCNLAAVTPVWVSGRPVGPITLGSCEKGSIPPGGLTIRSTGSSGACRRLGLHFILPQTPSYPTAPVNSHVRRPFSGEVRDLYIAF